MLSSYRVCFTIAAAKATTLCHTSMRGSHPLPDWIISNSINSRVLIINTINTIIDSLIMNLIIIILIDFNNARKKQHMKSKSQISYQN